MILQGQVFNGIGEAGAKKRGKADARAPASAQREGRWPCEMPPAQPNVLGIALLSSREMRTRRL